MAGPAKIRAARRVAMKIAGGCVAPRSRISADTLPRRPALAGPVAILIATLLYQPRT
jgi:hypothetical protein